MYVADSEVFKYRQFSVVCKYESSWMWREMDRPEGLSLRLCVILSEAKNLKARPFAPLRVTPCRVRLDAPYFVVKE